MADLAKITALGAKIAMRVAGTAKTTATLNLATTKTYDWAEDAATESGGTAKTASGVFYKASQKQREITGNEAFFLIEGATAPTVSESDVAVIEGQTWQIHDVGSVPGKAVIILGLRK